MRIWESKRIGGLKLSASGLKLSVKLSVRRFVSVTGWALVNTVWALISCEYSLGFDLLSTVWALIYLPWILGIKSRKLGRRMKLKLSCDFQAFAICLGDRMLSNDSRGRVLMGTKWDRITVNVHRNNCLLRTMPRRTGAHKAQTHGRAQSRRKPRRTGAKST